MKKTCERCKGEFEGKRSDARFCSDMCRSDSRHGIRREEFAARKCVECGKVFTPKRSRRTSMCGATCRHQKWLKSNHEKEALRKRSSTSEYMREYCTRNRDKIEDHRRQKYDSGGFIVANERSRERHKRLKREDPSRWSRENTRKNELNRTRRLRKKQAATRAAYLADPINAQRVAEANYARMTLEERDKWHEEIERQQEKADRKAKREAIRQDLAIAEAAKAATQDPTWAGLEWAP